MSGTLPDFIDRKFGAEGKRCFAACDGAIALYNNDFFDAEAEASVIGTPTSLAIGEVTGDTPCTTASFTPAASIILFAQVVTRLDGGTAPGASTLADSEGGTWTELFNVPATGANSIRHQLFWRAASASPASMTVTSTPPAGTTCSSVHISSIANISTDFSNSASDTDTAGDPSVDLPTTPASADLPMAWFGGVNTSTLFVPADYTSLYSDTIPTLIRYGSHYYTGPAQAGRNVIWATGTGASVGIVIALKALPVVTASGGELTVTATVGGSGAKAGAGRGDLSLTLQLGGVGAEVEGGEEYHESGASLVLSPSFGGYGSGGSASGAGMAGTNSTRMASGFATPIWRARKVCSK